MSISSSATELDPERARSDAAPAPGGEPLTRRAFVGSLAAAPLAWGLGAADAAAAGGEAPLPRTDRGARRHVVVVGAGAFGGWTALALLRSGFRVTLVEGWGPGHSRASSGGETRVIRAVYGGVADYVEMAHRALALWRAAERRWNRRVLHHTGALWMCPRDDTYVRSSIEPMRRVGLSVEELSLDAAAQRFPQMSFRGVRSVFFEPEAGFLEARVACERVRQEFVAAGGEYRQGWAQPVSAAGARLPALALATGDSIRGDHFVFACGPWLPQIFPEVVGRRIVPTRQEVFFFGPPAGDTRYDPPSLPAWIHLGERTVYGVPVHDRRGVKIADDTAGEEVDPTTLERTPSAAGLARAREQLAARFPALADAPLVEARVCQYEASSDGDYLVDRHPALANVWLVGGGSGHGFKMGPAMGEYVALLVQGRAPLRPRFAWHRLQPRPG